MKKFLMSVLVSVICFGFTSIGKADVKIGLVLPVTGPVAFAGKAMVKAIELALDEVNSKGGINGEMVTTQLEDSRSDPKEAVNAVAKLIEMDKIKIIVGPARSGSVLACKPLIDKANAVLVAPASTHPDIPDASKGIFRVCTSDAAQGVVAARLAKDLGIRKVGILFENTDYGKGLSDIFKGKAKEINISVLIAESYTPGDQDFRTQLTKIKGKNVECLYLVAIAETPSILQQTNLLKLNTVVIGSDGTKDLKILERGAADMEGMWCVSAPFWQESPDPTTQKFINSYKAKYGGEIPRMFGALGYDSVVALFEAIKREGTDPMKIREGLLSLKDFPGATGSITFLANGDVNKPFGVFRVENGKYVFKRFLQ